MIVRHDTQEGRAKDLGTNKTMRQSKFIECLLEYSVKGLDTSYKGGPLHSRDATQLPARSFAAPGPKHRRPPRPTDSARGKVPINTAASARDLRAEIIVGSARGAQPGPPFVVLHMISKFEKRKL